ncbi:MAG: extracellular solute-binding protein [Deltaproteobacteria bacterium]|nr:extracellular solute-binding protein [Deltaproteobacteria bacterium]
MARSCETKGSRSGVILWRVQVVFLVFLFFPLHFALAPGALFPVSGVAWGGTADAPSKGKQLLDELVRKAKQEGELVATIQSSWSKTLVQPLADAFRNRFGFDIKVTVATVNSARHFPVAIAETQSGAPATYDAVQGDDAETMQLVGAGGTQKIDGWEALLSEINPLVRAGKVRPDQISRGPFRDHSFAYMANVKQLIYNPKLIPEKDLPRTHRELADPKYKGKFTQPPWTSHWEIAPRCREAGGEEHGGCSG